MAITISGENNNDKILASDGVIDQLSGFSIVGVITATSFTGDVTGNLTGNVTGNINNSTLLLQTGSIERVRIDSSGVSIFKNKIVIDDGTNGHLFLNNTASDNTIHSGTTGFAAYKNLVINAAQHIFKASNTEKLRIDSAGRLLLNTTTTYTSNQMMIVKGASPSGGGNRPYDGQLAIESTETSGAINTGGVLAFIGHDGGTARGFGSIRNLKEDGTSGNYGTYMSFETRTNGSAPAEKLRIDSVGWLGLGQTSKDDAGQVAAFKNTSSNNSWLSVNVNNNTGTAGIVFGDSDNWAPAYIQFNHTHNRMEFHNSGEKLRIDSTGWIGVGQGTKDNAGQVAAFTNTSSSNSWLSVNVANNTGTGGVVFGRSNAWAPAYIQYNHTGNYMQFFSNSAEAIRINSVGSVMVGGTLQAGTNGGLNAEVTDSGNHRVPLALINQGTADNSGVIISHRGKDDAGNQEDYCYIKMVADDTGSGSEDSSMRFWTIGGGTLGERLRIANNGSVTIGKTSNQGKGLEVYQSADAAIRIQNSTTGTGANDGLLIEAGASQALVWNYESTPLKFGTAGTERLRIASNGNVIIGSGTPSGKLHIGDIGSGDIIAELTSGSPTFTYRNGGGSWMHAGKHPTANEFIISEGATTTTVQMLRIQGGGGTNDSKFKFPSVEAAAAHGHSTADIEIGGRHIWKRITSSNHVTTSTSTNHFYLAFWRNESGSQRTCYYKGVVVNVTASGNYDWGGHGYVTHSSQTILAFSSQSGGTARFLINEGYNYINNTNGGTNMKINSVSFSHDSTYLYANFKFTTNISGTGFKPHYNVEVIDPNQCTYTCVAF